MPEQKLMQLTVTRTSYTARSTVGQLSVDGNAFAVTLEPPVQTDKPRAIPAGTYNIRLLWSNRFQRITPHVMGVPGFENIELHPGNFPKDTEGCLLIGKEHPEPDFITHSNETFDRLMSCLREPISLTVADTLPSAGPS